MTRREWLLAGVVLAAALAAGLRYGSQMVAALIPPSTAGVVMDGLKVVTVAQRLEHPWSLAFLPDGSMLVSERPGRLRRLLASGELSLPIAGVPAVAAEGQGGLFDVLPDRDFARSRHIFLSYAEADTADSTRNGLAVARAVLSRDGRRLEQLRVIFRQWPKVASSGHFGGRLVLDRGGNLFVTLGDRQLDSERGKAQDPQQDHGKVVRLRPDGSTPADNPFAQQAGHRPLHWSLGHRNPQGAALHPLTGELWLSEHGPQGGDEINRVLAGRNYGWPLVTHGCEYVTCRQLGEGSSKVGMEDPLTVWVPSSIAPSGLAFYTGDRYPGWQGQLFSGALAGRALWRLRLDGNRIVEREVLLRDLGERIRDVRQGPDGWLYLLTDSRYGRVLRLER